MVNTTWEDRKPYADKFDYVPHAGQMLIHDNRHRFKVVNWGRRGGKTTGAAFEANFCQLLGGWVMCAAPTYNLANKVWFEAVTRIQNSEFKGLITELITQEGKQAIRLSTGGCIVAKSTDNPGSLMGDGWDLVIFDEAAEEPSPIPWGQKIRPALADTKGSALFTSTPKGDNWFHDIYNRGQSDANPDWWSVTLPSTINPKMDEEEIRSLTEGMTEDDIQQEIYGKFLGGGGSVFREYYKVCDAEWQDSPISGHTYCAGLDLGKNNDFTVLTIWDCTFNAQVHVLQLNLIPYPEMMRIVVPYLALFNAPVMCDATREEGTVDKLREDCYFTRVEKFWFNNDSKRRIMNQLNLSFEQRTSHLLCQDTEIGRKSYGEFGAYQYKKLPSGILQMSAPQGKFDDIVCSTALAYECNLRYMGISGGVTYQSQQGQVIKLAGQYSVRDMPTVAVTTGQSAGFRLARR